MMIRVFLFMILSLPCLAGDSYSLPHCNNSKLDLYTLPSFNEDPNYHWYKFCHDEYLKANPEVKNPLFNAPTNLSAGDSQTTIAQKIETTKLQVIGDMALKQLQTSDVGQGVLGSTKGIANSTQAMAAKVSGVTDHALSTKTSICDFKNSMKYDINNNTAQVQSVCESLNARLTYSTFSNSYEFNLFKQMQNESKIGVKTTNFSNSGLVFIEGKW